MILGRPENKRKRIIPTIMNEEEEFAFLNYFEGWKTNQQITKTLYPRSSKNIDTNVGRYSNKFLNKEWLNKKMEYVKYSFKTPSGRLATKGQFIPAYKGSIKPMLDYFAFYSDPIHFYSIFLEKYISPILYLFFELNEVREFFTTLAKVSFHNPLNIYEAFQKTIDRKLIYNWLYFEKRFYANLKKIVILEELAINQIPDIEKIKKLLEKYLKDKKDDSEKLELREGIIEIFNSSFDKFKKTKIFKEIIKINFLQNPDLRKKDISLLINEIKIKYFARLLYMPSSSKAIEKCFLEYTANSLINLQSKKDFTIDTEELKLLKYQLFS